MMCFCRVCMKKQHCSSQSKIHPVNTFSLQRKLSVLKASALVLFFLFCFCFLLFYIYYLAIIPQHTNDFLPPLHLHLWLDHCRHRDDNCPSCHSSLVRHVQRPCLFDSARSTPSRHLRHLLRSHQRWRV